MFWVLILKIHPRQAPIQMSSEEDGRTDIVHDMPALAQEEQVFVLAPMHIYFNHFTGTTACATCALIVPHAHSKMCRVMARQLR